MIILNPNGSVPTVSDFYIEYTGSYDPGDDVSLGLAYEVVTIATEIRYKLFVQAYAVENVGGEARNVDVSWTTSTTSATGCLNVIFKAPVSATLYYKISGVKDKVEPIDLELSNAGTLTASSPYTYLHSHNGQDSKKIGGASLDNVVDVIIAQAGTSATEVSKPTGVVLSYAQGSTGAYTITSDKDIFSTTLTSVQVSLDNGATGLTYMYQAYPHVFSTKVVGIDVYSHSINAPDVTTFAQAPSNIFVRIVTNK